jgi:hypothetical protein
VLRKMMLCPVGLPVVLQLVRRDFELLADLTMWTTERTIRTIISNPTIRLIAFDVDIIAPVGVSLSTARHRRNVRLHQGFVPADLVILLAGVAGVCGTP